MTKKIFIEFSEGPHPYERELTVSEAAKLGLTMTEQDTSTDLTSIRARQVENYKGMGLTEAEAKYAAELETKEVASYGIGLSL